MTITYTFVFTSAVILNSFGLGSQSRGDPPLRIPQSPEKSTLNVRARSPFSQPAPHRILGYPFEQLGYIRLCPHTNRSRQFEFRRYFISRSIPIRLQGEGGGKYSLMPTREHIVLSASNGEVFAILDDDGFLRGIYTTDTHRLRVKVNMMSGAVHIMTEGEIRDCPVGKNHPIVLENFIQTFANHDALHIESHLESKQNPAPPTPPTQDAENLTFPGEPSPRARYKSPPGRPPSNGVLGYALGQLGYIRLIPQTNPNRRFEFRRYVFPANDRILLKVSHSKFMPVPTLEHIVLATSNDDVYAILEYTGFLRGIYRRDRNHRRIRINILSGAIDNLTTDEMKECQVGSTHPIFPHLFMEVVANFDTLQTVYQ